MGKFNSLKDEVVYRATLDGCDDELGDVQGFDWYGLVRNFHGSDYIVREDSYGSVDITSYDLGGADADWDTLQKAYWEWESGEELGEE